MTYPGSKQMPDFGALELDDRGELVVFLRKGARLGNTAPQPRPVWPFRRRALWAAGAALIPICALIFAMSTSLRARTPIEAQPVGGGFAPPPERAEDTPVPRDARGTGAPDARPQAVPSYDPRRFDGLAMFPEAIRLDNAAGHVDDFGFLEFHTPNVRPDGTADLTVGELTRVQVRLFSKTLARWPAGVPRGASIDITCAVTVVFWADRLEVGDTDTECHRLKLLPPRV
jgi:hypothetical protein